MINNMRDLAGLVTADGKRIKEGMLVRSGKLMDATRDELEGIATVVDLRSTQERTDMPDKTYDLEYLIRPIVDDAVSGITHEKEEEEKKEEKEELIPIMGEMYAELINTKHQQFHDILTTIMTHDFSKGAILWHCTEGKDRCGMTTAILLEALGIDRKSIMEDYLKTNDYALPKAKKIREEALARGGEEYADATYKVFIADENYLKSAWEAMGDNYINDKLKLDKDIIENFKKQVLI